MKTLSRVFLACLCSIVTSFSATSALAQQISSCNPLVDLIEVELNKISDGDSFSIKPIALNDSKNKFKKVRIIGINTPEIATANTLSQPLADLAKNTLKSFLYGKKVFLHVGQQSKDNYKRLLAHVFVKSGDMYNNVTAAMLEKGLGWQVVIAPNVGYLECYYYYERSAYDSRNGVWQVSQYKPINADRAALFDSGFQLIRGTVEKVSASKNSIWVNLLGNVSLKIPRKKLDLFGEDYLSSLDKIVARGWVIDTGPEYRFKRYFININHPFMLQSSSEYSYSW